MNRDGLNSLESRIGCCLADGTFIIGEECFGKSFYEHDLNWKFFIRPDQTDVMLYGFSFAK